ncbi:MAG: beta-propeller fold lactonase family protein [Candidatus Solibacter usitatus]|nr:beta-propeller fold lactonase family protein [Candidatus Solibacter usitatus]
MKRGWVLVFGALLAMVTAAPPPKKPVYIGVRACGACHDGPQMGYQYSKWLLSRHAQGYAALAKPESREIAKRSGLRGEPLKEPVCLGCHSTASTAEEWEKDEAFRAEDGLQCEACHGPGSEYATDAVMRNRDEAMKAGLCLPGTDTCLGCHMEKGSHTAVLGNSTVDIPQAIKRIAHPRGDSTKPVAMPSLAPPLPPQPAGPEPRYKTPLNLAFRPGTGELWIACEASGTVVIVNAADDRIAAEVQAGGAPTGVAFTPDGARAFVSNRQDDTVTVIDAASRRVTRTLKTGDEPHGVLVDRAGKLLYVLNTASDDIYVYDAATLEWKKKLAAGRGPWALALSPDGGRIAATNTFSHLTGFRQQLKSELTVIETERGTVSDRRMVAGANLMTDVAWHPSGEYALAALNRTKNLAPMTRLMQGWVITNGLAVLWADGTVDQVLLDQPGLGFADATGVAITPDGRYALVTSSGTDRVAVVDCAKLTGMVKSANSEERRSVLPNHLGKSAAFVAAYIPTGKSPRGVAVSPDGAKAYVANSLDDSLTVIDLRKMQASAVVDLGGPKVTTKQRYGERLFHSANIAFRRQFSCHSCHPDGHVDGITYDIEADGIGVSPVDNRTLRGILDTAPFKWEGTNPTLTRQCGPRLSVFFTRIQPFTPAELDALDYYITTIPRPPNRYHVPGEPYTPAQKRGKALFERTTTADGRPIPPEGRCVTCHFPPYYTSRGVFDVGTRQGLDRTGKFDVPHLNNIYDSAPYLHNGMAATLEEIWTVHNPYDKHGVTNDLTKDQLNDLIEFLRTL